MIEPRRLFLLPNSARVAAMAAFLCAAPFCLAAVPSGAAASTQPSDTAAAQPLNLNLTGVPGVIYDGASSSSSSAIDPVAAERLNLGLNADDALQPPPRRRYGQPRYTDRMHNADGSSKIAIMAGGGFTVPSGSTTRDLLTTSYKLQGGLGINFNKESAILLQVDYDHFGLPGRLINNQIATYNSLGFYTQDPTTGAITNVDFSGLDGNAHIWSITLNPTFNFYQGDTFGAYAVVGGGFYHKVTNFTLPQTEVGFDYYYGPYTYTANVNFDTYVSNSAGLNGGIGFTFKPSRFASERLYAEARFVHTFDSAPTKGPAQFDFFPANHTASNYIPVTVGIRF